MRPGQKKGGTNEKKRGSSTSGRRLFAGGVCSIRSCASGRNFVPDRDFVPGIPRGGHLVQHGLQAMELILIQRAGQLGDAFLVELVQTVVQLACAVIQLSYLVTTSPQSSVPPSAAPSLQLGH